MACFTDVNYWVGGRRKPLDDHFRWLSGAAISDLWQPRHPNHHGPNTDFLCTEIERSDSLLKDRNCYTENLQSICEVVYDV